MARSRDHVRYAPTSLGFEVRALVPRVSWAVSAAPRPNYPRSRSPMHATLAGCQHPRVLKRNWSLHSLTQERSVTPALEPHRSILFSERTSGLAAAAWR